MTETLFTTDALRIDRPLLSRVADSIFWMSRYVERAEHVARVLKINNNLLMDVGDLAPTMLERQWLSVLRITSAGPPPDGRTPLGERVSRHLTFNGLNPGSLLSCVFQARENARAVRSEISAEMWEQLNQLYWYIQSDEAKTRFDEQSEEFYNQIMTASMQFQGLTDQTLTHDQRWNFAQLAKSLERIDVTCRILIARLEALEGAEGKLEAALLNIQWMAVLRMCCSIEAYRRQFLSDLDPLKVSTFLILEDNFPRSIRYNVSVALAAITSIRLSTTPLHTDPSERILGRLDALLHYAEPQEVKDSGVREYLTQIRQQVADASATVMATYFLK
ncbi:MAG: alpha-E domain-containing protein [Tepidisphaeraceae bacterium]